MNFRQLIRYNNNCENSFAQIKTGEKVKEFDKTFTICVRIGKEWEKTWN